MAIFHASGIKEFCGMQLLRFKISNTKKVRNLMKLKTQININLLPYAIIKLPTTSTKYSVINTGYRFSELFTA